MQQQPNSVLALPDPLSLAEDVLDAFAYSAKRYWWWTWGPLSAPMIRGIDAWADLQRQYLESLREVLGAESQP
jgi:hypothetical protein